MLKTEHRRVGARREGARRSVLRTYQELRRGVHTLWLMKDDGKHWKRHWQI